MNKPPETVLGCVVIYGQWPQLELQVIRGVPIRTFPYKKSYKLNAVIIYEENVLIVTLIESLPLNDHNTNL